MSASDRRFANLTLLFLTVVSFLGLVLVAFFSVSPPVSSVDFVWRKPVVGAVFASICVLGSLAVFFPDMCSQGFGLGSEERRQRWFPFDSKGDTLTSENSSFILRGHHPTCDRFSSHVFIVGGRVFCATCSGLFLGALICLAGVAAYFFGGWQTGQYASQSVLVGVVGVAVGLLQSPLIRIQRSSVRVFSGVLFAVGALLILVAVDELAGNFFLDVFMVLLTAFWLVTRIFLSQWEHEKMCSACGSASCEFGHWAKKMRSLGRRSAA